MRSKNAPALTRAENDHVERIKLMPCGVCGAGGGYSEPSEAHHIEQRKHFTVIPLCADCHRGGFNGLHGQARIWKVKRLSPMDVLNETIGAITAGLR